MWPCLPSRLHLKSDTLCYISFCCFLLSSHISSLYFISLKTVREIFFTKWPPEWPYSWIWISMLATLCQYVNQPGLASWKVTWHVEGVPSNSSHARHPSSPRYGGGHPRPSRSSWVCPDQKVLPTNPNSWVIEMSVVWGTWLSRLSRLAQ